VDKEYFTCIDMYEVVIYSIYSIDENISDTYIGRTTGYARRMEEHEMLSETSERKLYKFIRENGGWSNWKMKIVSRVMCGSKGDAALEELLWFLRLKPTLNMIRPGVNYYMRCMKVPRLYEKRRHILDMIEPYINHESMGSLRSSHDRETFLRPISLKPKPYQNDETPCPINPT